MSRLPPALPGIQITAHPDPLRSVYHTLLEMAPRLIAEHDPDVVVHVGLAPDQDYFGVEQGARRDGYHQIPDMERRVLSKAESKAVWGKKSPEVLETSFDLAHVLEMWRQRLGRNPAISGGGGGGGGGGAKGPRAKGKASAAVDVRHTDDVGNYVCGLIYYASLAELAKRGDGGSRYAVFLHVPLLLTEEVCKRGSLVLAALIESLVEAWSHR